MRYAFRKLINTPAMTAVAVLALGLGIGLTTMMFSIVYGGILKGLPFEDPEEILHVELSNLPKDIESIAVSIHDYRDMREQQTSFERLAAFYSGTVNVSGRERAERFQGAFVTASLFPLLGVRPELGRLIQPGEDTPGAQPVALIGHQLWRDRYDGDPEIVGRTIRTNGEQTTIVGVMPAWFRFPVEQEIWLPLRVNPLELDRGEGTLLEVVGRLRDDVDRDQAMLEFSGILKRLALEYPETNEGVTPIIKPFTEEYVGEEASALLFTMLGAVFLVLIIACANVANLLLSRAAMRGKEVGIRTALGASRWQIVRQFLGESFALATVGAALGVGIAWVGVRMFDAAIADTGVPFWMEFGIGGPVLLFVLAITTVSTVLSGILPAFKAARADVNEVLKDETRGSSSLRMGRLSRGLVVAEIALSCGLLVGAGLMIKSVAQLRNMDYAFDDDVFSARIGLFESEYPDDAARARFFDQLEARLQALPGVEVAALATALPATWNPNLPIAIEGETYQEDKDYPMAHQTAVTPGYFEAFGVEAVQGRLLGPEDRADGLHVALVNQSFVERHFDGESPLGQRVRTGRSDSEEPWHTIVGVVPDLMVSGIQDESPEGLYVPLAQRPGRFVSLVAATPGNPMEITADVRDAVAAIDRDLPLYWVERLADRIARDNWFYGVFGTIFMVFGVVALFLSAIGLYAIMSFSVSRRTREVGVRMAMGARSGDVVRLIFRQVMAQLGIGLVLGLALAAGLSQTLTLILYDVDPRDPAIFAAIVAVLSTAAAAAAFVPARRAAAVDPMVALRHE